jgi:hypothetical protein
LIDEDAPGADDEESPVVRDQQVLTHGGTR